MNPPIRVPDADLDQPTLRKFFISHLNRIFCAKSQLVDKLPLISQRAHFLDLQQALKETVETVQQQMARIKDMYILLHAKYQPESCVGLVGFLDEAFQSIGPPLDTPVLRDLSILFYMENIESVEMTSFCAMLHVAERLEQPDVVQLLQECYDEAKEGRTLYKSISQQYL